MPERARRRTFTAQYKLGIVAEYDAAPDGEKGAVLRRGDHQDRQQPGAAVFQRDPGRREPQVTLRHIAGRPGQQVRQIRPPVPGRAFASPADFNAQFTEWLDLANSRVVRTLRRHSPGHPYRGIRTGFWWPPQVRR